MRGRGGLPRLGSREVERMRTAGRLLAVESGKKGHVFPSWQFAEPDLLPGFEEVLGALRSLSPWTSVDATPVFSQQ